MSAQTVAVGGLVHRAFVWIIFLFGESNAWCHDGFAKMLPFNIVFSFHVDSLVLMPRGICSGYDFLFLK